MHLLQHQFETLKHSKSMKTHFQLCDATRVSEASRWMLKSSGYKTAEILNVIHNLKNHKM